MSDECALARDNKEKQVVSKKRAKQQEITIGRKESKDKQEKKQETDLLR